MNIDIGKTIRLSDILDTKDGRGLLIDTSIASTLGATEGLENLANVLQSIHHHSDGIIVNPGQAEHQAVHLGGRKRAAPIVRVDWTNAYRSDDFCLPVSKVKRLMISSSEDAMQLGALAVIASFLPGFDDEFESQNINDLSHLARSCHPLSMPLMVDIRPIGPGVSKTNYADSIKLGASFMQELGAEVLIIPECADDTFKLIVDWMKIPVLMRWTRNLSDLDITRMKSIGGAGLVLSETIFASPGYREQIKALYLQLHGQEDLI